MEQRSTSSLYGTFFSLLLVLVFSSFLIFVSVRTYILFGSYTGLTDHFNTIGVIFLIFWILVISLLPAPAAFAGPVTRVLTRASR